MTPTTGSQATWAFIEHEHRDLARGIDRIQEVAREIGRRAKPDVSADVLGVLRWFETTLEPHMAWEEATLYPEIDRRAGTPWATRAARLDHHQIRQVAAALRLGHRELSGHDFGDRQIDVRGRMCGLEALLRAHVEREERLLIPELDEDGGVPQLGAARSAGAARKVTRALV